MNDLKLAPGLSYASPYVMNGVDFQQLRYANAYLVRAVNPIRTRDSLAEMLIRHWFLK